MRCAAAAESSRSSDRFAAKSVHHLVLLHHSVQAARHEHSNRSTIPASAWLFELLGYPSRARANVRVSHDATLPQRPRPGALVRACSCPGCVAAAEIEHTFLA